MNTSTRDLINDLTDRTKANLAYAHSLRDWPAEALQWKAGDKIWSALECVDHINQYAKIYIENIQTGLQNSHRGPEDSFKSKGLGNWFAKLMSPGDQGTKMKTFKSKNPNGSEVPLSVIDVLIKDQQTFLSLLEQAKAKNLKKTRVPTDFGSWLKLSLGDSLRIIIYHNQRHLQQAERSLKASRAAQLT